MTREECGALLDSLNVGDKVEIGHVVVVHEIDEAKVLPDGSVQYRWVTLKDFWGVLTYVAAEDWRPEGERFIRVVSRALPPEPPEGSVVLDHSGYAYQRGEHSWEAARIYRNISWKSLNEFYAPIRVIYRPDQEALADWEKELLEQGEAS